MYVIFCMSVVVMNMSGRIMIRMISDIVMSVVRLCCLLKCVVS